MTRKRAGHMNHGQQRARLPSMRAGHTPDEKRIEGVCAVEIHDRFSGQDAFAGGIQPQSKHQWMSIQQEQPVFGMKGDLRVTQCEKPIATSLTRVVRSSLRLSRNEGKFRWVCRDKRGLHNFARLSATPACKGLPLLAGDPAGVAQIDRRVGDAIHTGDPLLHELSAIGTMPGYLCLTVRFLYQHNPSSSCSALPACYSRPT